jgi:hypothetical protein
MGHLRVIKSGHIYEIYAYEKEPLKTNRVEEKESDIDEWFDHGRTEEMELSLEQKQLERDLSNAGKRAIRARNTIRRLASSNFDNKSKFVTLTFGEHITDLTEAHKRFENFIKRLKYYLEKEKQHNDLKYICVVEFTKAGRIHYHMISNMPYVKNAILAEKWGNGFVKINRIKHVDNVGAYIVKYMTKDSADERLKGRKSYFTSKNNLERPVEFKGEIAKDILESLLGQKKVFSSSYPTEYLGQCEYTEYNLKRLT